MTVSYSQFLNNVYDENTSSVKVIGVIDSLPVLPAGEYHIGQIGGQSIVVSGSFTRPNDATIYSSNDCVSNSTSSTTLVTFSGLSRTNGNSGYLVKARLITNQSTNTTNFRLYLYTVNNPVIAVDNAPFTLLWANRGNRIGYIDFSSLFTEGSGSDSASALNDTLRLHFTTASGDVSLYGALVAKSAFTPSSGQMFFIELSAEQN